MIAYVEAELEVKEEHAKKKAEDNTDTRSKVLRNIVRIIYAHRNQNPTKRLKNDPRPHYSIVPIEETILGNTLPILEDDSYE